MNRAQDTTLPLGLDHPGSAPGRSPLPADGADGGHAGSRIGRGALSLGLLVAALTLTGSDLAAAGSPEGSARPRPAPGSKAVYLTFDDGPSQPYTRQVLDVLERHRAKATFFPIGSQLGAHRELVRRMVREGHAVGNHTHSHTNLTRLGAVELALELDRMHRALRRTTGTTTRILRPPYGATDAFVRQVAARRGYRIVMWDVDPQDWRGRSASAIAADVLTAVRPGAVVLLHDGGGDRSATVAALEVVLSTLSNRGYTFKSLR